MAAEETWRVLQACIGWIPSVVFYEGQELAWKCFFFGGDAVAGEKREWSESEGCAYGH